MPWFHSVSPARLLLFKTTVVEMRSPLQNKTTALIFNAPSQNEYTEQTPKFAPDKTIMYAL